MNLQTKDSDGSVIIYANPNCPPVEKPGFTIRQVDALPPGSGRVKWDSASSALVRVPDYGALNKALLAAFKTAPIQFQVVYSNTTEEVAALIGDGKLTEAVVALQGSIDDELVPAKYAPLIQAMIADITKAMPPVPPAQ